LRIFLVCLIGFVGYDIDVIGDISGNIGLFEFIIGI